MRIFVCLRVDGGLKGQAMENKFGQGQWSHSLRVILKILSLKVNTLTNRLLTESEI